MMEYEIVVSYSGVDLSTVGKGYKAIVDAVMPAGLEHPAGSTVAIYLRETTTLKQRIRKTGGSG